ncbi:hypothetical protein [Arthrobacter sp. UYEF20]|uniref:hypothetical protein n=1 Tax=Arthrobacter sp. UYEF20 TaxID=1756363 RepID=UPI003394B906
MNTPERLSRLIRDIPGVTALYPADPAWQRTAAGIADAITGAGSLPEAAVTLSTVGTATSVQVRIGVDPASPAPAVARRVAAAIRNELTTSPPIATAPASMEVTVTVRISLITPPEHTGAAGLRKPNTPGDTAPEPYRADGPRCNYCGSDPAFAGDGPENQEHGDGAEDGEQPCPEVEKATRAADENPRPDSPAKDCPENSHDFKSFHSSRPHLKKLQVGDTVRIREAEYRVTTVGHRHHMVQLDLEAQDGEHATLVGPTRARLPFRAGRAPERQESAVNLPKQVRDLPRRLLH